MPNSFIRWLLRVKIIHVLFGILVAFVITFSNYDLRGTFLPQFISNLLFTACIVPVAYIEYYWFAPDYLYKRKFFRFTIFSFLLIILDGLISYLVGMFVYHLLAHKDMFPSVQNVLGLIFSSLIFAFLAAAFGLMIKTIVNRFQMERKIHEVEREKINTELNFLRSQVNPHFLFNILNTIYFQIDKSNSPARTSLEKLSEMLRYQLYDCTSDKVNIEAEIEYLRNYLSMQSLRMEKGTNISFYCSDNLSGFYIAPLLILPLVENAFKHISNYKNPFDNLIQIRLEKLGSDFCLEVLNTYDSLDTVKYLANNGGLGVQNLQRRLNLLYPHRHLLNMEMAENLFKATLKITCDD